MAISLPTLGRGSKGIDLDKRHTLLCTYNFLAAARAKDHKKVLASRVALGLGAVLMAFAGLNVSNARNELNAVGTKAVATENSADLVQRDISELVGIDLEEFAVLEKQALAARAAGETSTNTEALWSAVLATKPSGVTIESFNLDRDTTADAPVGQRIMNVSAVAGSADLFYEWVDSLEQQPDFFLLEGDEGARIDFRDGALAIEITVRLFPGAFTEGGF